MQQSRGPRSARQSCVSIQGVNLLQSYAHDLAQTLCLWPTTVARKVAAFERSAQSFSVLWESVLVHVGFGSIDIRSRVLLSF